MRTFLSWMKTLMDHHKNNCRDSAEGEDVYTAIGLAISNAMR